MLVILGKLEILNWLVVNKGKHPYFHWYCHSNTLLMCQNSSQSLPRNLTHRKWVWLFEIKISTEIQETSLSISFGTCAAHKLIFLWKRRQLYVLLLVSNLGLPSPNWSLQLKSIFFPIRHVLISCYHHITTSSSHCFLQSVVYWYVPEQGKEGTPNRLCYFFKLITVKAKETESEEENLWPKIADQCNRHIQN